MKKFVCPVCGYVYEGENPPEKCPQCGAPGSTFKEVKEESKSWAAEHVVGIAKDVPEDILEGLRANFTGECSEVGMYLAMARVAHREGYPESVFTGKRLPMKRQSMPLNLQSFSVRSSQTAPKRTLR